MSTLTKFNRWFADFGPYYAGVLQKSCAEPYQNYITGNITSCSGGDGRDCRVSPVISCLLTNTDPLVTANAAAASVLLGLLPTILLQAGANTMQNNFLSMKRPFLGMLLSMSSPAVSILQSQDYGRPGDVLQGAPVQTAWASEGRARVAMLCGQYLLAAGAVANVGHLVWQLSVQSTMSWAVRFPYAVVLWIITALLIQFFSALTLRLRVRWTEKESVGWLRREFELDCEVTESRLELKQETMLFFTVSWLVSTAAILHLMYGSVVLAGLLFISARDAVIIALRFFASAMAARAILAYELGALRTSIGMVIAPQRLAEGAQVEFDVEK